MEIKKQAGSGRRSSGMEEDCTGTDCSTAGGGGGGGGARVWGRKEEDKKYTYQARANVYCIR